VLDIAFSPSRHMIASGNWCRNTIQLWDARSGRLLRVFREQNTTVQGSQSNSRVRIGVSSVAFSPGGRVLASGGGLGDNNARLWDVNTGQLLRTLRGHRGPIEGVIFSPDSRVLASLSTYEDQSVRL
jgi:WD40 repeat protein